MINLKTVWTSCLQSTRAMLAISVGCVIVLTSSLSQAQLTPERLYHGIGQRIVVNVNAPDDFLGELTIKIHHPVTKEVLFEAPAARGRTDLTGLFSNLWSDQIDQVILAQLYLDSETLGAPLVLDPMVTPNRAVLLEPGTQQVTENPRGEVVFEDDRLAAQYAKGQASSAERESVFSGYRVYVDQEVVMTTTMGEIVFRLRPDAASNTAFNFMHLVEGGFYTDIIFHRIVEKLQDGRQFVIQVGDPSGTGAGGPGYMIDLEKSDLPHDFGVLSMARAADPDSNGSQVFVCLSRDGTSFLDGRYTAFAEAISGAAVIRKIAAVQVDENDRPLDPPMIQHAKLRPAPAVNKRKSAISKQTPLQEQSDTQERIESDDPGR